MMKPLDARNDLSFFLFGIVNYWRNFCISNTTAATVISCALFNGPLKQLIGLELVYQVEGSKNKIAVIKAGLNYMGKNSIVFVIFWQRLER